MLMYAYVCLCMQTAVAGSPGPPGPPGTPGKGFHLLEMQDCESYVPTLMVNERAN